MNTTTHFSLDELCQLSDSSKRTVRYYIQQGLVDRPIGQGRAAHYTQTHLEQLLLINKWQREGISLERIKQLMDDSNANVPPAKPRGAGTIEVWSHIVLADGIELHIEPSTAKLSPEQLKALPKLTTEWLHNIKHS